MLCCCKIEYGLFKYACPLSDVPGKGSWSQKSNSGSPGSCRTHCWALTLGFWDRHSLIFGADWTISTSHYFLLLGRRKTGALSFFPGTWDVRWISGTNLTVQHRAASQVLREKHSLQAFDIFKNTAFRTIYIFPIPIYNDARVKRSKPSWACS